MDLGEGYEQVIKKYYDKAKLLAADVFESILINDPEHYYLMPKSLMFKGWQQQKNCVGIDCYGLTPFQLLVCHCYEYLYAENFAKIATFYDLKYDGCVTDKIKRRIGNYKRVNMTAA